ncbi:MAG: radical SAM protein [Planctomycetota bacterium]|nr:radical SAM protein [Planctomycetota bacterium]
MKVALVNPSTTATRNVVRDILSGCWCKGRRIGGASVPPYMLLSIGAVLRQAGFEVALLDAQAESLSAQEAAGRLRDAGALVMSSSSMTFREDLAFLAQVRAANPRVTVILFGAHPTHMPRYCLASEHVDVVVRGEPEYLVRDCVRALESGRPFNTASPGGKGIAFRGEAGPVVGGQGEPITSLDDLPFMAIDLLPGGAAYFNPIALRTPYMTMMTSRGCAGRCTFCPVPAFYGRKVRVQSAGRVFAEFDFLKRNGFHEVYLRDEMFTVSPSRTADLCDMMIARKLDLSWVCNAKVGSVDKSMMRLMKRAGCHLLKFGVESGSQRILDLARKDIKLEETERTFRDAREAGIDTHAHVMLGMPGETRATMRETMRFTRLIRPTTASFGICTPLPGTRLFDIVAAKSPEIEDGSACDLAKLHSTAFFSRAFTDLPPELLEESMKRAYFEFYFRPGYLPECVHQMSGQGALRRLVRAGMQLAAFAFVGDG